MAETVSQTWQRVTGKSWSDAHSGGYTSGSAADNIALQKKLVGGWNPFDSSSSPSGQPSAADPTTTDPNAPSTTVDPLEKYLAAAHSQLDPGFSDIATAEKDQAQTTKDLYSGLASQSLSREPLVRQTYANLAAELEATYNSQVTQSKQTGEQNVGTARAGQAAAGIDTGATGSFSSGVTAAQNIETNQLNQLADKFKVDSATITTDLTSSVKDLYDKADTYKLQGNQEYAAAVTDLAKLKDQHDQEILSYATASRKADSDAEKQAWKEYIDQRRADHADQQANLMLQRLTDSENNAQTRFSIEQQRLTDTENKTNADTKKAYYNDLAKPSRKVAATSDQETNLGSGNFQTREELISYLQDKYPDADAESIKKDVYTQYPG